MKLLILATLLPLSLGSITCLDVGTTATATWTNSKNQTCSYTGLVGSNYGANTAGDGEYVFFPFFFFNTHTVLLGQTANNTATRVMAAAAPDVLDSGLEMPIRRIASRMISARTLIMRRVVPGQYLVASYPIASLKNLGL